MTVEKPTFKHGVMAGVLVGLLISLARPADVETVEIVTEADPKVRVEKVVEEKIIEVPTQIEVPLPEACIEAAALMKRPETLMSHYQRKASGLNEYLDYLDYRILNDSSAVTKTTFEMTDRIEGMSLVLFKYFEANADAQRAMRICRSEIEE